MTEQKLKLRKKAKKEVKRIVVITDIREIINKLFQVMKLHIGEENRIRRRNLFIAVYNIKPEDTTELQEWMMWEMLKRAMHRMRQRTKCFIVSKAYPESQYSAKYQGVWNFWVANEMTDYIIYRDNLERNIRAMRNMEKKCENAIKNKWYNEDWNYK